MRKNGGTIKKTGIMQSLLGVRKEKLLAIKNFFKEKILSKFAVSDTKKTYFLYAFSALAVVALLFVVGIFSNGKYSFFRNNVGYSETYALVNEKVSMSAPITIALPPGYTKDEVKKGITFDPVISGSWVEASSEKAIIFRPNKSLDVGKFYAVSFKSGETEMSDDFYVDKDPAIEAIFPAKGSEVNENSNITIVFNRPMVPLSTLDTLETKELPITITPQTEGKWKWISTRNLQFIPKNKLARSSSYVVAVGDGFVSVEGLTVKGTTHHFTTRPLRYVDVSSGETIYNKPISIMFNQPVDIDRTVKEIIVRNGATNIPIVAEYAISKTYNSKTKSYEEYINRSVINVYQKKDRFGRDRLWDFNTGYALVISRAYPQEGDKNLSESRSTSIRVPEIIASLSATSKRSEQVRPDLFDPQGELNVIFYEEVDRSRSDIVAKGLQKVEYGKKCKNDEFGNIIRLDSGECAEEEDKKVLILSFNPVVFAPGENVPISFNSIYNTSGLRVNTKTITKNIRTYPKFAVTKTLPKDGEKNADLTKLTVCSNTPIKSVPNEEYKKSLIASGYLVFARWEASRYVDSSSSYYNCDIGEFETTIRYGLTPETKYSLTVKFEDDFLQREQRAVSFTTSVPESRYTRFYNMQKAYNVTPPGKTKLTYAVENLEYVNVHICKLPAEALLNETINLAKNTEPPSSSVCESVKTDVITLPKRYWVNNYFQIDIATYFQDTLGHYIVTFSNPNYILENNSRSGKSLPLYDRTYVSVTRLAVGEKKVQWNADYYADSRIEYEGRDVQGELIQPGQNLYWVTRFNTLAPLSGAVVSTFAGDKKYNLDKEDEKIHVASTLTTDAMGIARGDVIQDSVGVVVRYGIDSAIVSPWADTLQYTQGAENAGKTYLYTDRPIYRPGQEVFLKGIDRIGYDGSYEIFQKKDASLKIYDSRNTVIYEQNVPISAFGTYSASVVLKDDAPLGTYRIESFGNSAWFQVEEYVPAAFKVDVASGKEEYIVGDTMSIDVDAQYYFGVPVGQSEVSYSVTSQDYYFDKYQDEYFNFGNGWYSCRYCGYGDKFLFRGKTATDDNGKAHIEKVLDFSKFYSDESAVSSKIFVVDVTVKDTSGRSVSSQKSFIVHRGKVYLGVKTDDYAVSKNQEFTIRGKSVDTKGKSVGVSDVTLEISKITWESFKRREVDGGYYYQSEQKAKVVKKETFSTDGNGNWSGKYSLSEQGEYEIKLFMKDSAGNPVYAKTSFYVYGEGQVDIKPTNNATLEINAEKLDVSVGDVPKIVIKSPYSRAKALITTERGKIFDYQVVDVNLNLFEYSVPIKEEYAPNVYVSVLLLSDGPEIKFGQVMFTVDNKRHALKIDVTPNKIKYLPGERVTMDIKTTNYLGHPEPADVSLAVADLSVLALKGNPKKDPLSFFYDGFPLTVNTSSNIKNILEELDIPVGTKGGGGGADENLAAQKRGIFKDTAFWRSTILTDAAGKATVSFTLPDNLTTWQIEALGVTKNTLLGVNYKEITTQKPVMITPLKPRFIVPGDEFGIGAKIFNQSEHSQSFTVNLQSATLELLDTKGKKISLGAGKTETVYFRVKAPKTMQEGQHIFVLSAKGDEGEDTVENTISITKNNTYETVATANFTKTDSSVEYVYVPESVVLDRGGLTINANATMAVFLSDSLKYLAEYPYGCSEQIVSKLSSIGVLRRSLNISNVGDKIKLNNITFEGKTYTQEEAVKLGLNRLYQSQSPSGGFSYYPGMPENFHLTLYVVRALESLRKAGFEVNVDSLNRASAYLYQKITSDYTLYQDNNLVIYTAYTLGEVEGFNAENKNTLKSLVKKIVNNKNFLNENVNSMSLAYLSILTVRDEYPKNITNTVFATLENRIEVDGRGAYLKENQNNIDYQFYETRAGDTALLLKALVAHKNEHSLLDKIVRWLLKSRDKDGAWGSTNASLTVIDAMTDYLNWQKETESDFLLTGNLNGKQVFSFDFNKDTVLNTFTKFFPINTFPQNKTVKLEFNRTNRNNLVNNFYYDMSLKYYLPIDKISPRDEGITVTRELFTLADTENKAPKTEAKVGDVLHGRLTLILPKAYEFVSVEDYIPAGFELVNFSLSTEDRLLLQNENEETYENEWGYEGGVGAVALSLDTKQSFFKRTWLQMKEFFVGVKEIPTSAQIQMENIGEAGNYLDEIPMSATTLRPDINESHDDRLFLFMEHLIPGVYTFDYYVRALVPGVFQHLPAQAEEMYFPEVFGRTAGGYFTVKE